MGCKFLEDRKLMRRKSTNDGGEVKEKVDAQGGAFSPATNKNSASSFDFVQSGQPSKEFIQIKYIGLGKSNMAFQWLSIKQDGSSTIMGDPISQE
ncbi:hypothetical protein HPP92_004180 [Vanilla planifolia]|uniref:Uncharacterized protein n=1 Tax=Vanilla planifolia TaxID=51239 RepID=A0A835RQZ6_VANPL|nr:hypothetical protein HPP92_004180 [Vanilla planifolia]